jgi:hypothetical protein
MGQPVPAKIDIRAFVNPKPTIWLNGPPQVRLKPQDGGESVHVVEGAKGRAFQIQHRHFFAKPCHQSGHGDAVGWHGLGWKPFSQIRQRRVKPVLVMVRGAQAKASG